MNKSNLSKEDKLKIIELRKNGYTIKKITETLNKRFEVVAQYLKDNHVKKPLLKSIELSQEEIQDIIDMYQNNTYLYQIIEKYNDKIKTYKSVVKILKTNGINLRGKGLISSLKEHDFFEKIDSEEKAYILGFLISDGYIIKQKGKSPTIGFMIHINDRELLEKIKEIWKTDRMIGINREKRVFLHVTSEKMASDLEKYSVTTRKSFTVRCPFEKVPYEYHHHLIRGIFDGDGTVYNVNNQYHYLKFGFYGNEEIVTTIQDYLIKEINIQRIKISNRDETVYFFQNAKKEDVLNFYHYIYKDATIFLKRKKDKFEKYINDKC